MDRARPTVQVIVPAGWHRIPEGLDVLQRHLRRTYGATLIVMPARHPVSQPLALYLGEWDPPAGRAVREDVESLLPGAFYSLAWMGIQ